MILHTGIALGVTLVLLAIVMAILQYKEQVRHHRSIPLMFQTIFHFFLFFFRQKMFVNEKNSLNRFISMHSRSLCSFQIQSLIINLIYFLFVFSSMKMKNGILLLFSLCAFRMNCKNELKYEREFSTIICCR